MRIGVLGTGMVGRALAGRLDAVGHEVMVGTRDPSQTAARSAPDAMGTPPYSHWQAEHPAVALGTLAEAGAHAEVLLNATNGSGSLAALDGADVDGRAGLVVLDVANPLDFSGGGPLPSLTIVNTDSLGEAIARAHPSLRVVKALNTMNCEVMADPSRVPGEHQVFVSGDDDGAKETVAGLLRDMGWPADAVVDLGGLVTARGTEMYLLMWVALMQRLGTADFNVALRRA